MQYDSVRVERKDEALQTKVSTAWLLGVWIWPCTIFNSSCMGYEQEIETDKTVLQILYTDIFPIHATFFS